MNLPNKLTVIRILCVPIFIAFYVTEHFYVATAIFIAASLTDMLDGKIARERGLVTNFGKIMDPLADKILVISAFVLLVEETQVASWMLIVILAREFIVSGLRTVAASDGIVIAAGMSGKIKTVLQMIAVPLMMLHNWIFNYIGVPMDRIMLWACVIMTIVSGCEYIIKNKDVFTKGGV